jgi:hypothetical protein
MTTEIDFSQNTEWQPFSWPAASTSQSSESFFTLDDRELENLMKTAVTPNTLDETIFFGEHSSSPLCSPLSGSPMYDPQDSPSSDFQPMESSSDEEHDAAAFFHNDQFTQNLGEFGIVLDSMATPVELGVGFGAFIEATGSAFQTSCLPPLPVADQLLVSDEKPSKKRSRTNSTATKKEKFTVLSPDDLLKLDSKEIEEYIKTLSSKRSLAPSEEKELKRIRRLIKNREYAQSSRNKKKQYMEEMEKKLSDMAQGSAALEKRVKELELENRTLKIQLAKIGTAMKRDPSLLEKLKQASTPVPAPKMKAGAVLFIFLFSFGLFFSPLRQDTPRTPAAVSFSTARQLLDKDSFSSSAWLSGYSKYLPDFVLDFAARYFWTEPDLPDFCSETFEMCPSTMPSQGPTDDMVPVPSHEQELMVFNRVSDSGKAFVQTRHVESAAN